MKTTAEPFELFTPPAPGGSATATTASTPLSGQVEVTSLVEPDVLGRDATAALAFVVARRRAQDLEAAEELRPIGAGLSIWPNGDRALRELGLAEFAASALRTGGALRRSDGKVLA